MSHFEMNTYPYNSNPHDHALYLEHTLCDVEDFGSAVTEEDRLRAEALRRGEASRSVGYLATGWKQPGSDAMRYIPEGTPNVG